MKNASRYSRNAVLTAFEMIGGTEAMANWAEENPGEFYTKIFTKTIQKEVEVTQKNDVESLLEQLSAKDQAALEASMTIDAQFEMVEDDDKDE